MDIRLQHLIISKWLSTQIYMYDRVIVVIASTTFARCTRYNIVIKFVSDWAAGRWFSQFTPFDSNIYLWSYDSWNCIHRHCEVYSIQHSDKVCKWLGGRSVIFSIYSVWLKYICMIVYIVVIASIVIARCTRYNIVIKLVSD